VISSPPTASLTDRINRIPVITTSHRKWAILVALLLIFEMADLNAFAYVAPTLSEQWGLSVDAVAWLSAAAFLGMSAGALVGGYLADKVGRKKLLVYGTLFYSILSILSSTSSGPVELGVYRFLIGAGLYAVTVAALTYVSEMFPRAQRGRIQALLMALAFLGIPMMALVSRWLIPMSVDGWRYVFVFGGSGLVIALFTAWKLPESIRWQELLGKSDEKTEAIVAEMEADAEHRTGAPLPEPTPEPTVVQGKASDLVKGGYLKRTVVTSLTLVFAVTTFYGFNAWLPYLLGEHGFSQSQSLTYTFIIAIAACPGALLASVFAERLERRTSVMIACLLAAVLLLVVGTTGSDTMFLIAGIGVSLLLYFSTAIMYSYMPEIFPTSLRGLGTGIPNSIGRIATMLAMFAVASILSDLGFTSVFVFLAISMTLAGLIIGILGERTRGRSLESINAVPSAGRNRDADADKREGKVADPA